MAVTYSRHLLLLVNFLIIFVIDVTGQTVHVNGVQTVTVCSEGLRAQQDSFIITGEVDASGSNIENRRYIEYHAATGGSDFRSVCFTDLTRCSNIPSTGCYCVSKEANKYQTVINQTATKEYSESRIKLVWRQEDDSQSTESQVVQLPQIYGQNEETITLLVNGKQQVLTSTQCSFSLKEGRNDISYCCTNSPSPCTTKITNNGVDTTGDRCLELTVLESAAGLFRFTHTVCGRVLGSFDCQALYGNAGQRTTTTLSPPLLSSSDDSDGLPGWGTALIVIFVLGFVVALIIGLYCWWKRKADLSKRRTEERPVTFKKDVKATTTGKDGITHSLEQKESYEGPAHTYAQRDLSRNRDTITFPTAPSHRNCLEYY